MRPSEAQGRPLPASNFAFLKANTRILYDEVSTTLQRKSKHLWGGALILRYEGPAKAFFMLH